MALANLAVEFRLKGAGESQRQVEALGNAFSKLAGSVDRSGGIIRSAWSTTLGMLQSSAITGALNGLSAGMSRLVKMPGEIMDSRYELSKALGQLAGAGMEPAELKQVEQAGHDYISKWGHTNAVAYTNAFYEIQSSIQFASMKTKQEISEALQTMGSVTQLSSEEAVKMGAKWLHQFNLTRLPENQMVERLKQLAGQFKGAIDVGVFRGPDLMESLKESVPILLEKGWKSSDIFAASAFWQSKGFQGSSTGVALREWGQRFIDANAYAMVGAEIYTKRGQRALDEYIMHPLRHKGDILKAKKLLFAEGFDQAGMKRQMEQYQSFLGKLPEYARHEIRKKGEHEALQPYTKAAFANWQELQRFTAEVEGGTYENLKSKAEMANSLYDKIRDTLGNASKSLMQTAGTVMENTWNRALEGIRDKLIDVRKHIQENKHSYERVVGAGSRGFWHGLADIDDKGPLSELAQRGQKYLNALESKNQIQIAMESYQLGNSIAKSIASTINSVIGKDGMVSKIGDKMDTVVSSMQQAATSLSLISDALLSVAGWFGYQNPDDIKKEEEARLERVKNADERPEAVIEAEKRSEFWVNIKDWIVEGIKAAAVSEGMRILESQSGTARLEGPITGTLRIEGDRGTLNAVAPDNTANAMGR